MLKEMDDFEVYDMQSPALSGVVMGKWECCRT